LKIEEDEILFLSKKDLNREIRLKNEIVMSDFCLKIGDHHEYEESLRRAQNHFKLLSKNRNNINNIQIAKFQVLKASVVDIKKNFSEYESLMEEAIEYVRYQDPLHPDIAKYN
jgi:hypothetical protein